MATTLEQDTNIQERLYKVLVIGEYGVGKTSIIRRFTEGYFTPNYKLTIGVDFALKSINWNDTTKVNLQLWDIAGHERFGHMTRVYYKYAIGAIIVYDLSRPATFGSILKWLNDVNSKVMLANGQAIPVLLLANKSDVETAQAEKSVLNNFCKEHNLIGWFTTSAKNNTNIEESMHFIIKHILELPCDVEQPGKHIKLPDSTSPTDQYDESFEEEQPDRKRVKNECCS
ncbi:hypothetical protein ScPMuIL_013217 [Solemya velum]